MNIHEYYKLYYELWFVLKYSRYVYGNILKNCHTFEVKKCKIYIF